MRATENIRARLAAEGFLTEPTTAAATAEEQRSRRALEEASLGAAVAITQVHGFFGEAVDSLGGLGVDIDAMKASLVRLNEVAQSTPAAKSSPE
tara:strand:- start:169 stop:450 length:282 start_codon:yes stop_codon:yes gene_type:complete